MKFAKAITLSLAILNSVVSFAIPVTTAKNWVYSEFEAGSTGKAFSGGAEGAFVLNPTEGKTNTSVFVYKKAAPADWKASQDLRKWKILLAQFNTSNVKRNILKDSVLKDAKTGELSYVFEMNYMPAANLVHQVLGTVRIKGESAYLFIYDRPSADFKNDLAAAKELLKAIRIDSSN